MSFELKISGRTVEELMGNLRAVASSAAGAASATAGLSAAIAAHGAITAGTVSSEDEDDGTVNTSAPVFDSKGTPWLDGVHSSSKKLNGDGTWRRARGVDKAHAEAAETAARAGVPSQLHPAPVPQPMPQPMPQPAQQYTPAPVPQPAQQYTPAPVPQPAQQPMPQPMPQPAPAGDMDVTTFWMNVVNPLLASDANGQNYLATVAQRIGLTAFTDIVNNGALIPTALNIMRSDGKIA